MNDTNNATNGNDDALRNCTEVGSNPTLSASFPKENSESSIPDTVSTHKPEEICAEEMSKWPKKVKHRNKVLAKVYRPCQGRGSYRVVWYAAGGRQMKSFPTYAGKGGAKEYADALVKDIAKQSPAIMLTPAQATDALAAVERLNRYQEATGRKLSLLAAVSDYCDNAAKLRGHSLGEAISGFLRTAADVKRHDLSTAVEDFITSEEPRTKATNGDRAELNQKYHENRAAYLRRLAGTFPGYAACDLGKHDLDTFMSSKVLAASSAKTRNHHRAAITQFLAWCVRKDYLPGNHRLGEADKMRPEKTNTAETQCYTAKELRTLLETASGPLRAMIALGGLAGLRTEELIRLDWADVWRVKGHIEITAGKAKTRQRRLVEVNAALAAWLQPYREFKSGSLWEGSESAFHKAACALWETAGVTRKENALRHSFCSYAYVIHGENWTAQQAGNSPAMIHAHYKGLATKKEAEAWFAVKPAKPASNIVPMTQKGAAA